MKLAMRLGFAVLDRLNGLLVLFGALVVFAMMAHVTVDVVAQFLFSAPVPLTLEVVTYYYMVIIAFIPLAAVERKDGHIRVDIIVQFLPRLVQRLLDALTSLLGAGFFGFVAWVTLREALQRYQVGEFVMGAQSMIVWPGRFALPIGLGLFALLLGVKGLVLLFGGTVPPARAESGGDDDGDSESGDRT